MFNLFPRFERGRIMKKELLWALRDYSYESLKIQYQDYSNGILKGLDITVEEDAVVLGTGMVKFDEFIYLITEPVRVPYEATNEYVCLKGRVRKDERNPDYILHGIDFFMDSNLERDVDEFEICRFKLRKGFKLRNDYKAFYDINTEFDTINLVNSTWAGIDKETMNPNILKQYAVELIKRNNLEYCDFAFCILVLSNRGNVSLQDICVYLNCKCNMGNLNLHNLMDIYYKMNSIILMTSKEDVVHSNVNYKQQIIVD